MLDRIKHELELIGAFDAQTDFYGGETGKAVMELVECFSKQGHSGMSASLVARLFYDAVTGKTLSPLKCDTSEWFIYDDAHPDNKQNNRCGAVFKKGNELPYYLDAIVWRDRKTGATYTNGMSKIKFVPPFLPKTFYVEADSIEVAKDDWEWRNPDIAMLDKAREYYMPESLTEEQALEIQECFVKIGINMSIIVVEKQEAETKADETVKDCLTVEKQDLTDAPFEGLEGVKVGDGVLFSDGVVRKVTAIDRTTFLPHAIKVIPPVSDELCYFDINSGKHWDGKTLIHAIRIATPLDVKLYGGEI